MAQVSFPKLEEEILDWWERENIFQKTLAKESPQGEFVFYEGPPTANGRPGIHHVLARAFKDLIPRYKTMQGYQVRRKAGWDTHGLPVELQVEKELGISGKPDIENLKGTQAESIKYFNEQCKQSVWQYKEDWEKMTRRMGFWIDMKNPYVTYDNDYIETLWWIIKQVYDKGLLYQGHKVVPHCPRCGTALSSHEVALGYRQIKEPSVFLKFKVKNGNDKVKPGDYILSWSTTPWTLPGNVALAVGNDFDYVKVRIRNQESGVKENLILAKALLNMVDDGEVKDEFKGKDIIGIKYEPLFPGAIPESVANYKNAYKVYPADFVTIEDGTGVVHTAVMYGEDDYNLGEAVGLPKVHTVDEEGKFRFKITPPSLPPLSKGGTEGGYDSPVSNETPVNILSELQGRFVKDEATDKIIIDYLKKQGILLTSQDYTHDYPFCWRCDTPLLYYAKDSWFIKMSALREQLIKNNQEINWVPAHIKTGRFGEWLEGIKDWAISRERFWGTPLPVWHCQSGKNQKSKIKNQKYCNNIKVIGSIKELEELSGQKITDVHRPFVDTITFKCDKCGSDMVRESSVIDCWFDSGAMPFAQIHYPFQNKELVDNQRWYPADYISEAIDQTRGWFYTLLAISTLLDKGTCYKNVICLGHINDKEGRKMSKRWGNIVDPWEVMNKYGADSLRWHFYTVNQPGEPKKFDPLAVEEVLKKNWLILWNVLSFYKLYAGKVAGNVLKSNNVMDKWILARLTETVGVVTDCLDDYNITTGARNISEFINELSTWYVRRSRDRFKAGSNDQLEAVVTLGRVLVALAKLLAPFAPFVAEKLYQELSKDCPVKNQEFKQSVHLEDWPESKVLEEGQKLILLEMKQVREIVEQALARRAVNKIKVRQPLNRLSITNEKLSEELISIIKDEINVKEVVVGDNFNLDVNISEELRLEGVYREMVRSVNALRKQAGLTIDNQVDLLFFSESDLVNEMLTKYSDDLRQATLTRKIITDQKPGQDWLAVKMSDGQVLVALVK